MLVGEVPLRGEEPPGSPRGYSGLGASGNPERPQALWDPERGAGNKGEAMTVKQ